MEKFRIQPKDIEIPEENPFKYDQLGRRKLIESLTNLMGAIEGPCVIAVDAPWGAGKTTFLRMWSQHLRNQKFPVVEFNAWETDFSDDPFVALCAEMNRGFGKGEGTGPAIEFKEAAVEVIKHIGSNTVEKVTGGLVVPTKLLADLVDTATQERLDKYQKAQKVIEEFKEKLESMTDALTTEVEQTDADDQKPLVVMIDELDRCRPTYAVELLETTKHLFAVDQVVFVLAVNRSELQHAVKALYGNEFKADGYLRRFIDLDVRLPEPYLENFLNDLLDSMGLKDDYWFEKLLKSFFRASSPPLRDIAQTVHRLGLVLNSLPDSNNSVAKMTAVALILRTLDEELYHRFARRDISDLDLANEIFKPSSSISNWRWTQEGVMFQTGIVRAYWQMINNTKPTPLEGEIQRHIESEEDGIVNGALQTGQSVARDALKYPHHTTPLFRSAYEHIELMFSLIDDKSE